MTIEVDGRTVPIDGDGRRRLSELIRDRAGVTSVKVGCEEGACGACTVQLDGRAVPSCLVPSDRARGAVVRTAATLAQTSTGQRVVEALARHAAVQCGFCSPGIVVEAVTAIESAGSAGAGPLAPERILAGHLCRCTGYVPVVAALRDVLSAAGGGNGAPSAEGVRVDLPAKASGTAPYAADAVPRPHLFATVVGSPVSHARVRVDTAAAAAVPGVVAALGPDDDPGVLWSPAPHGQVLDTLVLTGEPRFRGDIVAAVAARSREALERGVAALTIEVVEPLAAVDDLDAAVRPGARIAWSASETNVVLDAAVGADAEVVEAAMAGAAVVAEATYTIDPGPHGYLERPAAAAAWAGPGTPCRVWSTTQHPYLAAPMLARILGVPADTVSFDPVYVGGGFGGKEELWLEPVAALLSRACGGEPVLVEVDRETTNLSRSRHGGRVSVRSGATDRRIVAWHVAVELDAGGDSGHSPDVTRSAIGRSIRAVNVPAARAVGRAARTNRTPATAFRGFGGPEALFAVESEVDEWCRRLGVDPVELRIAHGLRQGMADPVTGRPLATFELEACLRRAVARAGPRPAPAADGLVRGRGLAAVCDTSGIGRPGAVDEAAARCTLQGGRLVVETGVAEIGQGNHTAFRCIAAGALGVVEDLVEVRPVASSAAPPDGGVYASRGIYVTGTAVHDAAVRLRAALCAAGADRLGGTAGSVDLRPDGVLDAGARQLPLSALDDVVADGRFVAPDSGLVAAAQVVDVEVDPATGIVTVTRVTSVHDIGRVVHPTLARGQVYGAVVQGIGMALMDPVGATPRGFLDHMLPTAHDVPEIVVDFVEVPHPTTPLGAKGIGEAPIIGIAPAIANAVADATGARVRHLPMTPERVLDAIAEADRRRGTVGV
jgi:CO/xanthine dehydrogenase Mo-binding subunit/aerobic-type carbon monoxide dehydrogenase small subunit (CoxS/CutS family)